MAEISGPFMRTLDVGVRTQFNQFLQTAPSMFKTISMVIPSTSRANFYPKLDEIPGLREWLGDRVIHSMKTGGFSIENKTFEGTIGIDRDDIDDDQFGIFNIGVQQLGKNAGDFPDLLVFGLLKKGTTTKCWDGQNFFDTDHETSDANGDTISYANISTPQGTETAGPMWFLFDTNQPLQPMIFQNRRDFSITSKTALDDDNVFRNKQFLWGTDGRCNAGFGLWQLAYASTRPLNSDTYGAARAAMAGQRRVDGTPYGIKPNILMVPSALEGQANGLMTSDQVPVLAPDGKTWVSGSNPWKGTAKPVVCSHL
ncbi:Mu-like prophage major head subunit gpT family protein [Gluconobacter frateurii]|uniref:Mu-like prophage major head subunit gpT n=1 Tax=Gluconobacter frateurii NRIC 0228 TaxID=1307946 RepID=A0ABQ0Q924_9PROT|nr:Mu-like prophage major head subunit gpT family protein [Gluconobacter frateurii]GBR09498.1 Mu-like prophage major head subunit gpT [Gluconobacter frateurii NRIC 0228]GLP91944.1 head protein [Gluconobacter frateurii]